MKIVIDYSSGGLRLSAEAVERLRSGSISNAGPQGHLLDYCTLNSCSEAVIPPYPRQLRHHPELLDLIADLGKRTFCVECDVRLVDVPSGADWKIIETEGFEWILTSTANGSNTEFKPRYMPL